jgi:hypothetical protein
MQNREELRQKGHDGSQKTTCRERGKKYHFQKGGGINIVFGPKYRPLNGGEAGRTGPGRANHTLDGCPSIHLPSEPWTIHEVLQVSKYNFLTELETRNTISADIQTPW